MRRWQRPYSLDIATGFAMLGLVGAAGFTTFFVVMSARGALPVPWAILCGVWLTAALAVAARQTMLGVYVSDDGVRSCSLLRTTTVPWASVSDIRSGTATIAGLDMGRAAIIIERTDGFPIQTPLQRGDLLRPFTFRPELGRLATWPEHYDEILATLRAHHRDAQHRRQPTHTGQRAQPSAVGAPSASSSAAVSRTGTRSGALTADQRRDLHALTRQHQRGALTDAQFAEELAKIHGNV